jgi:formylglycine-generating enzyme required for sulfatase activity
MAVASVAAVAVPAATAARPQRPTTKLPARITHRASGISFVLIPAGEFRMGSPEGEAGHENIERQHRRVIRKPFYISETEVTVGQFRRFVAATKYQTDAERGVRENDRTGTGAFASTPDGDRDWHAAASWRNPFPNLSDYRIREDHPVVQVSWNDARRFAEHFGLRLPTEAQWEYAARAGSQTRFFWGEAEAGGLGYGNVQDAAGRKRFPRWNSSFPFDDGAALLAPVGRYRPNAWKVVYDIQGNVAEWTEDAYRRDYPADGADEAAARGEANAARVIRGGSWLDSPEFQRSAKRIVFLPEGRRDFIGFRVVFDAASAK